MNKVKLFVRLPLDLKVLMIRILFLSFYYRIALLHSPFYKLASKIGKQGYETDRTDLPDENDIIRKVRWAVPKVCHHTPWESKCFVQALTAKKILNSKGKKCTLYMGVCNNEDKTGMLAHAWLRCGNTIVTGENVHKEFTVTGIFGDEVLP